MGRIDIGLPWRDACKAGLAGGVLEVAERSKEKFGKPPNCCHVHPANPSDDTLLTDGFKRVATPMALANCSRIGIRLGRRLHEAPG